MNDPPMEVCAIKKSDFVLSRTIEILYIDSECLVVSIYQPTNARYFQAQFDMVPTQVVNVSLNQEQ